MAGKGETLALAGVRGLTHADEPWRNHMHIKLINSSGCELDEIDDKDVDKVCERIGAWIETIRAMANLEKQHDFARECLLD